MTAQILLETEEVFGGLLKWIERTPTSWCCLQIGCALILILDILLEGGTRVLKRVKIVVEGSLGMAAQCAEQLFRKNPHNNMEH